MIGLFIDKEYNNKNKNINEKATISRKPTNGGLKSFEEKNIEFIRNYVDNSTTVADKIKKIMESTEKLEQIKRRNSVLEFPSNQTKNSVNIESSNFQKYCSYTNLSRNGI